MGFFSDLKNKVTGGAAKVTVSVGPAQRGQSATVTVRAVAAANAKVSNVYLLVRARETCEVTDFKPEGSDKKQTVRGSHVSYDHKLTIAGAQELTAGQEQTWTATIEIPQGIGPSLSGKIIDHVWELQAGLDMAGNDPDSGWQSFPVT